MKSNPVKKGLQKLKYSSKFKHKIYMIEIDEGFFTLLLHPARNKSFIFTILAATFISPSS